MSSWRLIVVALLSVSPISEVRGAIPYALLVFREPWSIIVACALSTGLNMLVPILAFKILEYLDRLMIKTKHSRLKGAYLWLLSYGRRRANNIRPGDYVALAAFVALPFPATGAWTGTLIAHLLGLDKRKSLASICIGVLIASVIVFFTAYLGLDILSKIFLIY